MKNWLWGIVIAIAGVSAGFAQDALGAPLVPGSRGAAQAAAACPSTNRIAQPVLAAQAAKGNLLPGTPLSTWSRDVQKLALANVEERIIASYITNCAGLFNLTATQIAYLKNAGLSPRIISVMIQHDQQLFPTAGLAMTAPVAPAKLAIAPAAPAAAPMVARDDSWGQDILLLNDACYAPDLPDNLGPLRAPYAVKLNDPIIMLKLPTFTVPCW